MNADKPVSSAEYSESYFLESCGGAEFFELYGPRILKPQLVHALRRARLVPGMRVLDIGCGRGEILYQARELQARPIGTDFSPAALKLAREVSGAPVVRCDAKALPFRGDTFDRIFFIGVIDHLHDWELTECFAEMRRVLRPGGKVLVHTCTNRHYYKTLTYGLRRALSRAGRSIGLPMKEPSPPRSGEDEKLHVNEHSRGDLERFFWSIGWECDVESLPNYKFLVRALYGEPLPDKFPMRPAAGWKTTAYLGALFHFPLDRILAREFFVEARPRAF